ncbi:MAG: NADH-quinone oxidoreductase subunit A [Terriglobales bacterium]
MPDNYFARYLPLLIQLAIALALAGGMVVLSTLVGRHRYSRAKMSPYECGMTPVGDARERFSVKFYLVAMLFILFDVEAVFLYPWAVLLRELKMFGFWEMLVYIGIVLVGLFYVWNKGVLDWSGAERISAGVSSAPATMVHPGEAPGAAPAVMAPMEGGKR